MLKSQNVTMDKAIFTSKSQDITNYKKRDDEELKTMDYLPPG